MPSTQESRDEWFNSLTPEEQEIFLGLSSEDQIIISVTNSGGDMGDAFDLIPSSFDGLSGVIGGIAGFMLAGPAGAAVGGAIGGSIDGRTAEARAANEAAEGQQGAINEQRTARDQAREDLMPFTEIGLEAGEQLKSLLADPSQQLDEINPIVDILRNQGFEQIQETAAAGGRLSAGGTLKDLTQFNTDLATTVVPQLQQQKFNQLFNLLGIGQNSAAGQGSATLQTSSNIGNALGNIGNINSNRVIGQQNQNTNMLNSIFKAYGAFGGGSGSSGGSQDSNGFNNNLASDAVQF